MRKTTGKNCKNNLKMLKHELKKYEKMPLKCEETSLNIRQIFLKDAKSAKRKDREIWEWKKMYRIKRRNDNDSNKKNKRSVKTGKCIKY